MSDFRIITNNVPRDVIDAWQLTAAERERFDYLNWPAIEDGRDSASFFRYHGELYDMGDFMRVEHVPSLDGWDGYASDSFFSGTVVRYTADLESVIVGRYVS